MKKEKEKNKKKEITWTREQEEVIRVMIGESESIGWTQGYDEAIKEMIKELEMKIFELKKMIFIRPAK